MSQNGYLLLQCYDCLGWYYGSSCCSRCFPAEQPAQAMLCAVLVQGFGVSLGEELGVHRQRIHLRPSLGYVRARPWEVELAKQLDREHGWRFFSLWAGSKADGIRRPKRAKRAYPRRLHVLPMRLAVEDRRAYFQRRRARESGDQPGPLHPHRLAEQGI